MSAKKQQIHKADLGYSFMGIPIHAAHGLHEYAMQVIEKKIKNGKKVLDLGCGSGAFSKRLQETGFVTTSVDMALDTFSLKTEAYEVDLNKDFSHVDSLNKKHDAIVALEVIEHLENPLNFLRQIKEISNADTLVFISFPNIYLYWSVLSFYRKGVFNCFDSQMYWGSGHQTLLTDWLFEQHVEKTEGVIVDKFFCANFKFPTGIKGLLHRLFYYFIRIFDGKVISAEARFNSIVLYVLKF